MKKYIFILLLSSILLPIQAFAIGVGITGSCTVWREGMPLPGTSEIPFGTYCKSSTGADSAQRAYELEVAVNALEQNNNQLKLEIQDLKNRLTTIQQESNLKNAGISELGNRVSKLESSFLELKNGIMSNLKSILLAIMNKK